MTVAANPVPRAPWRLWRSPYLWLATIHLLGDAVVVLTSGLLVLLTVAVAILAWPLAYVGIPLTVGANRFVYHVAGWELASHTVNHSDLTTLGAGELEEEVAGSRKILQREYGVPVKNFCYPAGQFDATVIAAVEAAGYAGATTEIPGYAERDAPYELARFEVLGSTGVGGLAGDLEG